MFSTKMNGVIKQTKTRDSVSQEMEIFKTPTFVYLQYYPDMWCVSLSLLWSSTILYLDGDAALLKACLDMISVSASPSLPCLSCDKAFLQYVLYMSSVIMCTNDTIRKATKHLVSWNNKHVPRFLRAHSLYIISENTHFYQ